MSERLFPIMGLSYDAYKDVREMRAKGCTSVVIAVPWSLLAPHEQQAQSNHSQSLARLAERGGLGPDEALAIIEGRRWHRMDNVEANDRLLALVRATPTTGTAP